MRIGIHLPQFGRSIAPGGIQRAAKAAEDLGFDDLWVSDHLVNPKEQPYPAPFILDPLQTLAFAAAVTETIGIGTSVLVGPQYTSPLALANTLAGLDYMSGGRLTLGIGTGWSKREYEALGASMEHRGEKLDEMLRMFRTVWENDPADFAGTHYASFEDIRVLPQPAHRIPIWIGGRTGAAIRRALRNDGLHAMDIEPDETRALVAQLREQRPDDDFAVSMRVSWNPKEVDVGAIADRVAVYRDVGIDAVHVAPDRGDLESWLETQASLAKVVVT